MRETTQMSLEEFLAATRSLTADEYAEAHPYPVLLLEEEADAGSAGFLTTTTHPDQMGTDSTKAPTNEEVRVDSPSGSPRAQVLPLQKPGNESATMITLGRSAQNDVRINTPSVSKLHAYFTCSPRGGGWHVADAGSSNGTFLDGERLEVRRRVPLRSGSALRFGPDVVAHFFECREFFGFLEAFRKKRE